MIPLDILEMIRESDPTLFEIHQLPEPSCFVERADGFGAAPMWNEDAVCKAIQGHLKFYVPVI